MRKCAPIDLACSSTAARVSKTRTTAPSPRAAPAAARPATPPPTTNTLAGGVRPAAVIWPAKKPPYAWPASTMALYPATLAIDDSVSKAWARDRVRGMASRARAVAPRAASAASRSLLRAGCRYDTSTPSALSASVSVGATGGRTFSTTSAPRASAAAGATRAPAAA